MPWHQLTDDAHKKAGAKSYSRAGNASYALRRFADAASYFEKQHELNPEDKQCAEMLSKTRQRIEEQESGFFDISRLRRSTSRRTPRIDGADYFVNTTVQMSPLGKDGRRGLFATRDFKQGDLIMVEKAFSNLDPREKILCNRQMGRPLS